MGGSGFIVLAQKNALVDPVTRYLNLYIGEKVVLASQNRESPRRYSTMDFLAKKQAQTLTQSNPR